MTRQGPIDEAALRACRLSRVRQLMEACDAADGAYDGLCEEKIIVCIERYVGAEGGSRGVELEQPVWNTAAGPVLLSDHPLEDDYG